MCNILKNRLASSYDILTVTFTNKAASEMKSRIEQMLGVNTAGWWIGTFHSMGARILRKNPEIVGLKKQFTIIDTDDQLKLLKQVLSFHNIDDKRWPAKNLSYVIQRWKDKGLNPDNIDHYGSDFANNKGAILYETYQKRLKTLNAADYGVPQLRKRVFLVGHKNMFEYSFPKPIILKKNYRTVGDTIMDLVNNKKIQNHVPMKHNDIVRKRISFINEGGGITKNIPKNLLLGSRSDYKNNKLKNFSHIYKRLHRKLPSGTMVPGHNAFPLHPTLDRALTVREAARLQTFPDKIIFEGTRQEQCILVGNAVSVQLAKILGKSIKESLDFSLNKINKLNIK